MKESATIAFAQVKSEISNYDYDKFDFHLHVPAGAIPKDGPSAGVTMYTVFKSLLLNKEISQEVAMTGEVSLTGDVLPIGGLREKLTAAYNYGIKKVFIPEKNQVDLAEIDQQIIKNLEIKVIESVKELDELFED